jgi:ribosomal protein L16 Arg81 hydroxylase
VRFEELILNPGDALFIPIGWWHQVTSLDFSVSATYTNFRWPNEGWQDHPAHDAVQAS